VRIRVLGNGGFLNDGLPYNCFCIDDTFLIDAPPDVMLSLKSRNVDFTGINRIFISHFHGDHYFGMPFFVLNLFSHYLHTGDSVRPIQIIGQRGLRKALIQIQELATSPDNPSVAFIDRVFRFTEIDSFSEVALDGGRRLIFHEMTHSKPCYGFSVVEKDEIRLTFLCDTKWSDSIACLLSRRPRLVLCDLNARPGDKIREHMSQADIMEKAVPITGTATRYVGVHLWRAAEEGRGPLTYARVGDEYEI